MVRAWITGSVVVATAFLLASDRAVAQLRQAERVPHNLAVEIVNEETPRSQFPVGAGPDGGFMERGPTRRLPDWKQPEGVPPLTRLRFRAQMDGAAVSIKVFVVFDDSLVVDSPGPKYGAREQFVASYLVREGEAVCARELADFGLEPPLLRVVKATPQPVEQPLVAGGEVVSRLKAVEVVSFWLDSSAPTSYRLLLRNLTQKNITALEIYEAEDGRRGGHSIEMRAGTGRPLIAAGGVRETEVGGGGSSGRMTPQGFVPDPPRAPTFVVGTVVFADGTYEGEAEVAARMEARQAGRLVQLARVVLLLKALEEAPEFDQTAAITDLKSQISTLRIDVDVTVVNRLLARYPSLTGEGHKRELTARVMDGLRGAREEVLRAIKEFEQASPRGPSGGNLLEWLSRTRERFDHVIQAGQL
jgi:hypothetical protein